MLTWLDQLCRQLTMPEDIDRHHGDPRKALAFHVGAKLDFGHFRSGVDPEVRLGGDVIEGFVERHGFGAERPWCGPA